MEWFLFALLFYQISFLCSQSLPLLLLVSFDGFRWDYPKIHGPLTNFTRLERHGVRAPSMIPTFTTAIFPNHYSLITGLYEESHGLVSDEIYDRRSNEIFRSWETNSSQWWPIKTIWSINEQRFGARSGVIGWPQKFIDVSKSEIYREGRSFKDIVDQILRWFDDSNEPINFGAIYFPEPGLTGRRSGPYSPETKQKVKECDDNLGYLLNEIDKNVKLKNNLHLIVTSDHGMEQVNATDRPMYLEQYVDMTKCKAFGTKTTLNIFVNNPNDINTIYRNLSKIPNSDTYKKDQLPDQYHYKTHPHIGDLIIILNSGYELHRLSLDNGNTVNSSRTHGNSGYDNQLESMKTIFYATGPELKENLTLSNSDSLHSVDLFLLMCLILNIGKCPPSNSTATHIQSFLIDSSKVASIIGKEIEKLHDGPMGLVLYLLVLVSFVLILIMAVAWSTVAFRNASAMARAAHPDAATLAEQNQYKFTQISDLKLHPAIGDDNL